jgi:peptidase inhibitor family I36
MTIRRIAAAAVAFTLTLFGALAVTASPAAAAVPQSCTNNSVCGFGANQFNLYEGYEWIVGAVGSCQNVGLNDSWTSVYNNFGRTVRLYRDANCGNGVWSLASGGSLSNMALYQPSWNDKISSVRLSG